jgi:hypothetical protein
MLDLQFVAHALASAAASLPVCLTSHSCLGALSLPALPAGVPLAQERIVALSEPKEVWYFDLGNPPDRSDVKTVDIEFTRWVGGVVIG